MVTIFEFGKWLQEHGSSLTEFVEASTTSRKGYFPNNQAVISYLSEVFAGERDPVEPKDIIDESVFWYGTKQGSSYWRELHEKWEKYCNKILEEGR